MKRNNYAFSAGIMLIIIASFCILSAVGYLGEVSVLIETGDLSSEFVEEWGMFSMFATTVLAIAIVFNVLQAVAFMILGVKIYKKSKACMPLAKMKSNIILAIVFAGISFVFDMSVNNILIIAVIILLSFALAFKDKPKEETVVADDKLVERVKSLKELKDSGVISQEEFEKMLSKSISNNVEEKDEDKKDII